LGLVTLLLAACAGSPPTPVVDRSRSPAPAIAAPPEPQSYSLKRGGGYYQDDGPGDNPPQDLDAIPDAVPKREPLQKFANNPYSVLGRDYVPMRELKPYRARGLASWYGRKFHGQKTSSGERYDMYGMTAAHATLPIPSYARVTNADSGKSVVVRVNDRGPFHSGRIIDLSYTAAWKLGLVGSGSGLVEVESVLPGQELLLASAPTGESPPIAQRPAPDPSAGDPPLAEVKDVGGTWLQLGAFGNRDNAEALKSRMERELGSLGDKLVVQASGNLFRLQLGPWTSAEEAHRMAARLAETLEMKPVVVQR
jgi:rare lipoprotein A